MGDLQQLKNFARAREDQEKRLSERRRNALVLIMRHLVDSGYVETYQRLSTECNLSLNKVDVADNMDLMRIIQEFEEGYEYKFGKKPKLVKRLVEEVSAGGGGVRLQRVPSASSAGPSGASPLVGPGPSGSAGGALGRSPSLVDGPPMSGALAARQRRDRGALTAEDQRKQEMLERRQRAMDAYKPPPEVGMQRVAGVTVDARGPLSGASREEVNAMQVQGLVVARQAGAAGGAQGAAARPAAAAGSSDDDSDPESFFDRRVLKPLPASLQGELRELGAAITRDIFTDNPNVRWEDIAGLEGAKELLKEAVVQPMRYPELYTGLLAPWKGVLLYGPPGTGKTLLAKAVATECKTTFFNIQASSIVSKWRGDSEKLVRVLFELARHHAPSTIFMDEIDALMSARGEGEHEASRRMKTELLTQMDGLAKSNALVFVMAATNLPWELDKAMLRRLDKHILVPLPNLEARRRMFDSLLVGRLQPGVSTTLLAEKTEGYSGSDVTLVAKEAAMRPLRRLMSRLDGPGADLKAKRELEPITEDDVMAALAATKPTARLDEQKYMKFLESVRSGQ